jgi:hypothetical protein
LRQPPESPLCRPPRGRRAQRITRAGAAGRHAVPPKAESAKPKAETKSQKPKAKSQKPKAKAKTKSQKQKTKNQKPKALKNSPLPHAHQDVYNTASRKASDQLPGEVAEWSNVPDSKSGVR